MRLLLLIKKKITSVGKEPFQLKHSLSIFFPQYQWIQNITVILFDNFNLVY